MNLPLVASLVGLVAVLVTTGIITVGASTLIFNITKDAFLKATHKHTGVETLVHKGHDIDNLRQELRLYPNQVKLGFYLSQTLLIVLTLAICAYLNFGTFEVSHGDLPIDIELGLSRNSVDAFLGVMVTFQIAYVVYVVRKALILKEKYYSLIGAKII